MVVLVSAALLVLAASCFSPSNAHANTELVCPCRVESSNQTTVDVTFGIRNLLKDDDTGPLEARLSGRRQGEETWWRLASTELPAVEAATTTAPRVHTMSFQQPWNSGTYELRLDISKKEGVRLDTVYWLSEGDYQGYLTNG